MDTAKTERVTKKYRIKEINGVEHFFRKEKNLLIIEITYQFLGKHIFMWFGHMLLIILMIFINYFGLLFNIHFWT